MFYEEVFQSLNKHDVRYLVVGGVAVNLHGIPRMTYDLDLMIALVPDNVRKAWTSLSELGFVPRVPIKLDQFIDPQKRQEFREKKNMVVLSFFRGESEFRVIDIFVDNPLNFDSCYERRESRNIASIKVDVINAQDLIALKSINPRKRDLEDIDALNLILPKPHG